MAQMCRGEVPEPPTAARGLVYLALQELATRIAHHNTGKLLTDSYGYEVMKRVAVDENFHYLWYRDLASAAFELDPSMMIIALDAELLSFAMPGTGIPDFGAHARAISRAGIYDFRVHHEQILVPVVGRHWAIESWTGLSAAAERARDSILNHVEKVGRVASRIAERQGETSAVGTS
jgi:acyl-[acyl-carrier-protein] desaturase